ncbi:xanthine dehydrogenase family protein molybdopterin-binding subunit [Sphingomonas koreensis]|nr:xanthine dehydrogenase family protein molybdopterin-binding subunit [Sphingomonas koreensis]
MAASDTRHIDRRSLLIGGGAGLGLILAWAVWPRRYAENLTAAKGETIMGAWLKIGDDGHITVAVPQAEHGQGVYTTLPQVVADQLGADWRTVGVEPAPLNPLYANPLAADALFAGVFDALPEGFRRAHAERSALVLTGGSSSVRMFADDLAQAGASARVLLCKAAARRWGVDWQACRTAEGFVVHGHDRLRFAELASAAAGEKLSGSVPLRSDADGRLIGQSLPRLDVPSKVDGSANFAGDIRLPDMVYAAIRQGPVGDSRLVSTDRAAADRIRGVVEVVENPRWVAAIATNWWAANQALDALAPRFETKGAIVDSAAIDAALDAAFAAKGERMAAAGNLSAAFNGAEVITADYRVGMAVHAAVETMTATAHFHDGRLELWLPTQAPGLARAAAAATLGIGVDDVLVHPMLIGGSFGANLEHLVAEQAALLTQRLKRPVQLVWSRAEDLLHDRYRPAAAGKMAARLDANGRVLAMQTRIAAPRTGHELARRLIGGDAAMAFAAALPGRGDGYAVAGATPFYAIPNFAVDHYPAEIGVPTGHWRSGAHSYTAFFTECFIDELAHRAGTEALSFRIAMLGDNPRLARCLSTAASLGGWGGGVAGSGQGIACHAFRGSYIAVLAEAHLDEAQRPRVDRLVAAVDCGRMVNPDVVKQQIEGGLIFGVAQAVGAATGFTDNLADARGVRDLALPRLADSPDITVELIASDADPGGVGELAVPPVAPAIANALQSGTGFRIRTVPLSTVPA